MKQAIQRITIIMGVLCFIRVDASACSCLPDTPSVQTNFESADMVFAGKVVQVNNDSNDGAITFQVSRVWKGQLTQTETFPVVWGDSCMYGFSRGTSYLIYANLRERPSFGSNSNGTLFRSAPKVFVPSYCGRTSILNGASGRLGNSDIAILGTGYSPVPNQPHRNYLGMSLFVLAIFTIGAISMRQLKRN